MLYVYLPIITYTYAYTLKLMTEERHYYSGNVLTHSNMLCKRYIHTNPVSFRDKFMQPSRSCRTNRNESKGT